MRALVTINQVKDGVVRSLKDQYPLVDIYDEEIKQGLTSPCFSVLILNTSQDHLMNHRHKRNNSIVVRYFATTNEECHDIAEALYSILRRITLDNGRATGSAMTHEIVDSIMHFFVHYNFHVMDQAQEQPKMLSIKQEVGLQ
ncbi:MAG: DUF6838 family protein [Candidatus Pristimantibacillus sp.]